MVRFDLSVSIDPDPGIDPEPGIDPGIDPEPGIDMNYYEFSANVLCIFKLYIKE